MAQIEHRDQKKGLSEPDYAQSDKKKTQYPWYIKSVDKHLIPAVSDALLTFPITYSVPLKGAGSPLNDPEKQRRQKEYEIY